MTNNSLSTRFNMFNGLLFIALAILLSEPVIAPFTKDGEISSRTGVAILWALTTTLIGLGSLTILFRRSNGIFIKLTSMLSVTFLMFAAFDYGLYLIAHRLPLELVWYMTPEAQIRYQRKNAETTVWVYDGDIRYMKPLTEDLGMSDEFGYRNPADYITEDKSVDILMVGDSFTWGTEALTFADYMREQQPNKRIYSTGMSGSHPAQWATHYTDYKQRVNGEDPEIIVLNLYVGNDLSDIDLFQKIKNHQTEDVAELFYASYTMPFTWPYTEDGTRTPKLPELPLIAYYSFIFTDWSDEEPANTNAEPPLGAGWIIRPEPSVEEFTPERIFEIGNAIEQIKQMSPDSQILVSYIPTVTGIYGSAFEVVPPGDKDILRQQENSAFLKEYVEGFGAELVDVSPVLQEAAADSLLWDESDHFSQEGYKAYALALGAELQKLDK